MGRLAADEFSLAAVRKPREISDRKAYGRIGIALFIAAILAILSAGWLHRDDPAIAPQNEFGYALGIVGGSMMLLVLLYPLRKRVRVMRNWARLAPWFRWHMVFGCLGPVLVVVHANFKAASLNGFMALTSTLIVASSGVIGRYLYVRIHKGLYGAKVEARELLGDAVSIRPGAGVQARTASAGWEEQIRAYEKRALAPTPSLSAAIRKAAVLAVGTRRAERVIANEAFRAARTNSNHLNRTALLAEHADFRKRLALYFRALRRAGSLAVYERLFALWHVLHLPLIALLIFTAIVHVVAVHLY